MAVVLETQEMPLSPSVLVDQLALQAREGNREATEELVSRLEGLVRLVSRPYWLTAGGDREDLMQEARLGLLRALDSWQPGRRTFLSFAYLCLRRQMAATLRNQGRRKHRMLTDALYTSLDASIGPAQNDEGREGQLLVSVQAEEDDPEGRILDDEAHQARVRLLRELKDKLTELEWQSAWLVLAEGWSYKAAARALGRHPKAVDNAVQRARRKARTRVLMLAGDRRWAPVLEHVDLSAEADQEAAVL